GYINEKLGANEMLSWVQHHIQNGFAALEKLLEKHAGKYATGDEPFLADLYLAPQIDGAVRRFSVDMSEFPLLSKINESYKELPAFQDAMPGKQPDTPPEASNQIQSCIDILQQSDPKFARCMFSSQSESSSHSIKWQGNDL
ncbi:glutathione S-transferase zeta 1, partial [Perilla frutescens var. hirtella]